MTQPLYGTIDTPLRFYKTLRKQLVENMGLTISKAEPCMIFKKEKCNLVLIVVTFVDDLHIEGIPQEAKWCQEHLKKSINITDLGQVRKHQGIWHKWKKDNEGNRFIEASMHKMVDEIIKNMARK